MTTFLCISGKYVTPTFTLLFVLEPGKIDLRNKFGDTVLYAENGVNGTVVIYGTISVRNEAQIREKRKYYFLSIKYTTTIIL